MYKILVSCKIDVESRYKDVDKRILVSIVCKVLFYSSTLGNDTKFYDLYTFKVYDQSADINQINNKNNGGGQFCNCNHKL